MKRRRGYTLIEMSVVFFLTGIVLAVLGATFHLLFRTADTHRHALQRGIAVQRLADQFRSDCRQAVRFALNSDSEVQLQQDAGDRIVYAVEKGSVVRTVFHDDQAVGKEAYRFGDQHAAQFAAEATNRLQLNIETSPQPSSADSAPRSRFTIEATVSANRRFAPDEKGAERQ